MTSLESQLAETRQKESVILEDIDERNKQRTIQCCGCDDDHKIEELTAIQTHWYVEPHGCTGGAYWREGELQFVCPETGTINRLLFNNHNVPGGKRKLYENDPASQFKKLYRPLFKEVVETYDEKTTGNCVNNHYVDENREMFGLVGRK